ncbi:MAG: hypothetical protein U1D69_14225, partial [Polynucleobacter sp.]|nr:hypothetical protein [Polynucleobacter sp.]
DESYPHGLLGAVVQDALAVALLEERRTSGSDLVEELQYKTVSDPVVRFWRVPNACQTRLRAAPEKQTAVLPDCTAHRLGKMWRWPRNRPELWPEKGLCRCPVKP